jgi:hypothetical protein
LSLWLKNCVSHTKLKEEIFKYWILFLFTLPLKRAYNLQDFYCPPETYLLGTYYLPGSAQMAVVIKMNTYLCPCGVNVLKMNTVCGCRKFQTHCNSLYCLVNTWLDEWVPLWFLATLKALSTKENYVGGINMYIYQFVHLSSEWKVNPLLLSFMMELWTKLSRHG